jgi:hypothetical protein
MHWRVYDPVRSKIAEGKTNMSDYAGHQPWPVGEVAKALTGSAGVAAYTE